MIGIIFIYETLVQRLTSRLPKFLVTGTKETTVVNMSRNVIHVRDEKREDRQYEISGRSFGQTRQTLS